MSKKTYCTQNNGNCETCSLVSRNHDCQNNVITRKSPPIHFPIDLWSRLEKIKQERGISYTKIIIEGAKMFCDKIDKIYSKS